MKQIVVLSGAGMSAESGFSTFRDSGGLWEQYPVEKVASHEGWLSNPALVTDFYNGLRKQLVEAQPNKGHILLAELEKDYNVTVITQNVDNLHEKAGSSRVIHLHGELMKVCSSKNVEDANCIQTLSDSNPTVSEGAKAADGSLLRPYIVFFGEAVPKMEEAAAAVEQADIFIIIGTSLNVYPAAGLAGYARKTTPIYLIDPKPVSVNTSGNVFFIRKGASEGVAELMKTLTEIK